MNEQFSFIKPPNRALQYAIGATHLCHSKPCLNLFVLFGGDQRTNERLPRDPHTVQSIGHDNEICKINAHTYMKVEWRNDKDTQRNGNEMEKRGESAGIQ